MAYFRGMPKSSRIRAFRAVLFPFLLAGIAGTFQAQESLQHPSEFLGFDLGDRFSLHHEVTDFSKHVGAQPGATYVEYGSTYEQRPLHAIVFTHPDNLDRLEDIRLQHLDRVNGGTGDEAFDELAIVWMSYNVHGNEAVCTEAALEVMHVLAEKCAAGDPMMKRLVVLVDPCLNPDGHDRYAVWFNQHASFPPNADPEGMEHDEPWPGGRPNHYLFDLNRDWAWQKQQETQTRSALYHAWMPHVHCDYHEMGYNSPYYFAPAAEPYHEAITDWQREFQEEIGQAAAAKFDARGELYYTRESFDLLYPSYGDTYPIYNGAIGMTYEQGGSGRAGVLVERADGTLLSLRERIDNHVESSLSAIETSARLAGRLVDELAAFHETNRTQPQGRFGGYHIPVDAANASRVDRLVEFLERHEIECERATSTSRPVSAWEYGANRNRNVVIKQGDLLISSYQTHSRILDVLFDPDPALTDSLTYDITTWSVPYAYGLQTFGLSKPVQGGDWYQAQALPNWAPSSYGYAIAPDQDGYAHALAQLHQAGIRVRTSSKAIVHANAAYARGTMFVLRGDQSNESWANTLQSIGTQSHVAIVPMEGGHAIEGPDMGSDYVWLVEAPRVALITGDETSSLGSGEVWWHFERELEYPITRLNAAASSPSEWNDFDVVVLPSGWYGSASESWMEELSIWVRDGGRVVALSRAINLFTGESGWGLERYNDSALEQTVRARSSEERIANREKPYDERERHYAMRIGDGSIYAVGLDRSHPLAWGYPDRPYYTLRSSSSRYATLESGWTVGRYGGHVSGFVGSRANRELAGSMVVGAQSVGRGHAVYFADNPLFRGFWENGKRLFDNAVFMPLD